MAGEWNGNVTVTLVAIALVVCFGWIPVVALISIFHNGRAGLRASAERRGWVLPPPKEGTRIARQQKAPYIPRPQAALVNPSPRNLERAMSTRSKHSFVSWDPVKRWDTISSTEAGPKNESPRSNFSRPMPPPTRANSVRSAGPHPASGQGRGRRSTVNMPPDLPPQAFQINDTYYDTTPLPKRPPSIAASYAKSAGSRSQVSVASVASAASSSHSRSGASLDVPRAPARMASPSPRRSSRDSSRLEPSRPSSSRSEPSRPGPSRTEPLRPVSARAESSRPASSRVEQQDSPKRPSTPRDSDEPWWQRAATQSTQLPPHRTPPPRKASLHSTASQRPAWLDQPHAM